MDACNVLKRGKSVLLIMTWMAVMLATPAAVWAGCLNAFDESQQFNVLIDATSSCEALSGNMSGCTVDANGDCVIPNPGGGDSIVVKVTPSNAVGSIPSGPEFVSFEVTSGSVKGRSIDFAILVGATGGGTCGWSFTPGVDTAHGLAFEKRPDSYQKVNDIFLCSDFTAPAEQKAKVLVSKTVMLKGKTCGIDDVEVLEVGVGDEVQYCFSVENVGIGQATNVTLTDPDVSISSLTDGLVGTLDSGEKVTPTIVSDEVVIGYAGELTNTATVTWTNADLPAPDVGESSDTAKVVAEQKLVLCPPEYQDLVDGVIQGSEDGFDLAVLLDKDNPDLASICAPNITIKDPVTGEERSVTRTECVSECVPHEECATVPYSQACLDKLAVSSCQQSGAWGDPTLPNCAPAAPAGTLPYCWEVIQDPNAECVYEDVAPYKTQDFTFMFYHRNPFCYESCSGSGKKRSCETICF